MDYVYLLIAAILLAVSFAMNKLYQQKAGVSPIAGFRFNVFSGLLSALVFLIMGGFRPQFTLYSFLLSALVAALGLAYSLLGFRIMRSGSMALYTLFLMTGGMVLPYVFGLIFLDEELNPLRVVGLVILILAVALVNIKPKGTRLDIPQLLMCIAVFLLNGGVSIVSKIHQVSPEWLGIETVRTEDFVMYNGLTNALLAGIALLIFTLLNKKKGTPEKMTIKIYHFIPILVVSALVGGISYALQLAGATNLPATVLYPFITGGSMVFSTLTGIIVFRERPSKMVIISVILCFIGTLMFL